MKINQLIARSLFSTLASMVLTLSFSEPTQAMNAIRHTLSDTLPMLTRSLSHRIPHITQVSRFTPQRDFSNYYDRKKREEELAQQIKYQNEVADAERKKKEKEKRDNILYDLMLDDMIRNMDSSYSLSTTHKPPKEIDHSASSASRSLDSSNEPFTEPTTDSFFKKQEEEFEKSLKESVENDSVNLIEDTPSIVDSAIELGSNVLETASDVVTSVAEEILNNE